MASLRFLATSAPSEHLDGAREQFTGLANLMRCVARGLPIEKMTVRDQADGLNEHDSDGHVLRPLDLVRYIRDDASLGRGQIRIMAGTTAAEFILPTIAVAFRRCYPGVEVAITAAGTIASLDDAVLTRTHDLGMHSDPVTRPGVIKTHSWWRRR